MSVELVIQRVFVLVADEVGEELLGCAGDVSGRWCCTLSAGCTGAICACSSWCNHAARAGVLYLMRKVVLVLAHGSAKLAEDDVVVEVLLKGDADAKNKDEVLADFVLDVDAELVVLEVFALVADEVDGNCVSYLWCLCW